MIIHVVESGDTLYNLAQRYQVSLNEIIELNELPDPNQLVLGLALLIPIRGSWHTVQPGDNLWRIAQNYGVPLNTILQANPTIQPEALMPGMRVFVPFITHLVQAGETFTSNANLYGISAYALAQENRRNITEPIFTGETKTERTDTGEIQL